MLIFETPNFDNNLGCRKCVNVGPRHSRFRAKLRLKDSRPKPGRAGLSCRPVGAPRSSEGPEERRTALDRRAAGPPRSLPECSFSGGRRRAREPTLHWSLEHSCNLRLASDHISRKKFSDQISVNKFCSGFNALVMKDELEKETQ